MVCGKCTSADTGVRRCPGYLANSDLNNAKHVKPLKPDHPVCDTMVGDIMALASHMSGGVGCSWI